MTPNIDGRLSGWRRERLLALWAEGGARLTIAGGAAVLSAAVLDRLIGLPQEARWGLFAAGVAALAAGAAAWLLRPLALLEAGRVLDAAAQRWPEAKGFLRSAWELARAPLAPATSAALAERHLEAAERTAAALPRDVLFPVRLEARSKAHLAGVAFMWAGVLPFLGGPRTLSRVLFPWREAPLEAELEVAPGDARMPWGASVELSARWRAASAPVSLSLELRLDGGSWAVQSWDRWAGGGGVFRAERLTAPLDYRLVSRDRKSRVFRLTPVPFPRFGKLAARVHSPGGTVEDIPLDGAAEVAALRGSWVVVRGVPDRALDKAWLEATSLGGPVPMARGDDGAWEAGFPLQHDGTLRVHAEAEGLREPEPPVFSLRALEDRPPEAALLSPAFAVETSRRERLPVAYEARDDYGLSSLALLYRVGGGPERAIALSGIKSGATSHLGEYAWDLSAFPSGAKVEFRIRAVDNARPEPQTAFSPPGLVVLTDFESVHETVEKQWLGTEAQLAQLARQELRMREALAAAAVLPEGQRQARAEPLAAQDEELAKAWDRTASGLDEFAKGMENDPYANPGMAESSRALSDALENMRRKDLPAARAAQRGGDLPQAEKRHGELEAKVRRAGELLSAGREMQAMQDLWAEAQRMEQAGTEISGALEKMSSGGAPNAADKKKLDEAMKNLREQMDELAKVIAGLPKASEGSAAAERRKIYQIPLGDARQAMSSLEAALARGDYAEAARQAQELAKRLKAVHQAMAHAAQDFAESADQSPAKRLTELESAWKEAAEAQARALESVASVEESRLAERTKAQQALVDRLVEEQRAAVKEGERLGTWMPPGPLPDMRAVLAELEARRVREAPERLARAIDRLSAQAAALSPQGVPPPQAAKDIEALAQTERSILERLKDGGRGAPMTEEQLSQAFTAGAVQRQASKKASELEPMMDGLARDYGLDLGKAGAELSAARAEQGAAEEALGRRDTQGGQAAQERALEHLRKGSEAASESRRQSQSIQQGSQGPFGRSRGTARPYGGKGGRTGSDTSFVPLPGVGEYMPPRAIRGEVERSLQEKRPPAFDKAVDDYLRRLSQ